MAWPVVGKAFTPEAFKAYVDGLTWGDGGFRPLFIALHNTASPSLAQRPAGLTYQHIKNLESYYRDERNWNGGPHLFVDDKQIWVFNDLTKKGVHSPSWNSVALGIEMLGDYETESFCDGRGAKVRANTVAAVAVLNNKLGFSAASFKFHVEDKKSDHACPGKLARNERAALIAEIEAAMAGTKPIVVSEAVPEADDERGHPVISAADLPGDKPGIFSGVSGMSFAKVNALADEGSRLAQHIKAFKGMCWKGATVVAGGGGAASQLMDSQRGTGHALHSIASEHPWALAALVAIIIGGVAYWYIKRVEAGLVSAANEGRYKPRGA